MEVLEKLKLNKQYLGNYFYLFVLQYRSGCRITEALNISANDLSSEGMILIKGLKGSEDRIIHVTELEQLVRKSKATGRNLFYSMNRFTAYRLLKSVGVQKLKGGRKRESVTHIFRDIHAKNIRSITTNEKVLSQELGHKNINNIKYYGKN